MGTWGAGILEDDLARDVYDAYLDEFDGGRGDAEIVAQLSKRFADSLACPDEGPVFWLAVAHGQWECGCHSTPTKSSLMVDGHRESLTSGMSLVGEIKVGKRRIIEFFIYPLIKYLHEGMSVR